MPFDAPAVLSPVRDHVSFRHQTLPAVHERVEGVLNGNKGSRHIASSPSGSSSGRGNARHANMTIAETVNEKKNILVR